MQYIGVDRVGVQEVSLLIDVRGIPKYDPCAAATKDPKRQKSYYEKSPQS